jgi:hypothetical protein
MRIVVRDPCGLDHRLEHDGERWWGCENLAHGATMDRRGVLIEQVLRAIASRAPLPSGYRKVVLISGQRLSGLPGAAPEMLALVDALEP